MNVRLQQHLDFLAGVYFDNRLQFNSYGVNIQFTTRTTDNTELNIAMERVKYFMRAEMVNTVFLNQDHDTAAECLDALGVNLTTLPGDPVDQVVGIMLYCKLNAIMEGRMVVSSLDITSALSDNVWYLHDQEESLGPFTTDGWWDLPTCQHSSLDLELATDKVLKVVPNIWTELGLTWPESKPEHTANTIVYANFGHNEDNTVR